MQVRHGPSNGNGTTDWVVGTVFNYAFSITGLQNGNLLPDSPLIALGRTNTPFGPEAAHLIGGTVTVPEPSSALLASAGLGLLAFRRKRRA